MENIQPLKIGVALLSYSEKFFLGQVSLTHIPKESHTMRKPLAQDPVILIWLIQQSEVNL